MIQTTSCATANNNKVEPQYPFGLHSDLGNVASPLANRVSSHFVMSYAENYAHLIGWNSFLIFVLDPPINFQTICAERSLSSGSPVSQTWSRSVGLSSMLHPPGCSGAAGAGGAASPSSLMPSLSYHSLYSAPPMSSSCHSSHNSSIYDLTAEVDALEVAIRQV